MATGGHRSNHETSSIGTLDDKKKTSDTAVVTECVAISAFAVLGCLARIYTDRFTSGVPLLQGSVVPNALGSLLLGALSAPALSPDMRMPPQLLRGLTVGFCGCFTTYSGWNLRVSRAGTGGAGTPGSIPVLGGVGGPKGVAVIALAAAVSLSFFCACFTAGDSVARAFASRRLRKPPSARRQGDQPALPGGFGAASSPGWVLGGACCMAGAVLMEVGAASAGAGTSAWVQKRRVDLMVGLFGPLGALCRYYLSRSLNSRCLDGAFPLGTFVANLSGSVAMGLVYYGWEGRTMSAWDRAIVEGFKGGFLGGLTTMSTFVAELVGHRKRFGVSASYLYLATTVMGTLLAVTGVAAIL